MPPAETGIPPDLRDVERGKPLSESGNRWLATAARLSREVNVLAGTGPMRHSRASRADPF